MRRAVSIPDEGVDTLENTETVVFVISMAKRRGRNRVATDGDVSTVVASLVDQSEAIHNYRLCFISPRSSSCQTKMSGSIEAAIKLEISV